MALGSPLSLKAGTRTPSDTSCRHRLVLASVMADSSLIPSPVQHSLSPLLSHIDILEAIFDTITYHGMHDGDTALHDIRLFSQVCKAWRSVVLGMPRLWGRSIDITKLSQLKSCLWAEEVLRRAGPISSLWIRGHFRFPDLPIKALQWSLQPGSFPHFFFSLESQWSRVEIFQVIADSPIHKKVLHDRWWLKFLCLPSPRLRTFSLISDKALDLYPGRFIFGNDAPVLTNFRITSLSFDVMAASWLVHLRDLVMNIRLPLNDTLKLIQIAPCLETLSLAIQSASGMPTGTPKPVHNHTLKEVHILDSYADECLRFVASVDLSPRCSLNIDAARYNWGEANAANFDPSFVEMSATALHNLYESYFHDRKAIKMEITLHTRVAIQVKFFLEYANLTISVPIFLANWRQYFFPPISPSSITIHSLNLDIQASIPHCRKSHQIGGEECEVCDSYSLSAFKALLLSSSIRVLETSPGSLDYLLALQRIIGQHNLLLPSLTSLRSPAGPEFMPRLLRYLHFRQDVGRPLYVLNLAFTQSPTAVTERCAELPPWLECCKGLITSKILWSHHRDGEWRDQEYICQPEY